MKHIFIFLFSISLYAQKEPLSSKDTLIMPVETTSLENISFEYASENNLTFLNGFNFDFQDSKNKTGYIGNINIFFPITELIKLNTGLRKINYSSNINDLGPKYQVDLLKIKPLDEVSSGDKYLKEYNKYSTTVKISSWSAYIQGLYKLYSNESENSKVYGHVHTELLLSDVDYANQVKNLQQDTLIATEPMTLGYRNQAESDFEQNKTYFGFYFGVGVTGDFLVLNENNYKLKFFAQVTAGFTNIRQNNSENERPYVITPDPNPLYSFDNFTFNLDPQRKTFYLLHSTFSNKFNGIEILIGSEIRGVYVRAPLYIFYVGLSTDLKKLAEVFK